MDHPKPIARNCIQTMSLVFENVVQRTLAKGAKSSSNNEHLPIAALLKFDDRFWFVSCVCTTKNKGLLHGHCAPVHASQLFSRSLNS